MKYTLNNIFMLAVGAAIGSAVTWKIVKTKYEQITREEIDSFKEEYSRRHSVKPIDDAMDEESKEILDDILQEESYTNYSRKDEVKPTVKKDYEPYVIDSCEFDTLDDWEAITLTYYSDGVLVDDMNEPIDDVDDIIGCEALTLFGTNEDDPDTVYVRNERLKVDYEILQDMDRYEDNKNDNPHLAEG